MNMNNKKIYPDNDTLTHIQSIRAERKNRSLTQGDLASMLGVGQRTVSGYERGKIYPLLHIYLRLAEIFKWDVKNNPNYIFYHSYRSRIKRLVRLKKKYAYSNFELSKKANVTEEMVRHVLDADNRASVSSFVAVMKVLAAEEELARVRSAILRR